MKLDYEKFHKEVTKAYLRCGKSLSPEKEKALREKQYMTKYRLYSLDEAQYKEFTKNGFSFTNFDHAKTAKIWSYIFKNTEYMGIGHLAISHFKGFQGRKNHPLIQYWNELKTWAKSIENWAHADMLCSVYCDMLSEDPKKVYPELKKWAKKKSPWQNRVAIVSLLYYYNPKRQLLPFADIIALVEPHLETDHYHLQKAIGWNLRELSKAYPEEYREFLQVNLLRLSPTAFTTAVEKLSKAEKDPLKERRKLARTGSR